MWGKVLIGADRLQVPQGPEVLEVQRIEGEVEPHGAGCD